MRKNFLLVLLLTLLPLAGWAQKPAGVQDEPVLASTITWDGSPHQLITTAATPVSGYNSGSWAGGDWGDYPTYYEDDEPGIQYYIQAPSASAPVDGYTVTHDSFLFFSWDTYSITWTHNTTGVFTDIAEGTATSPGVYTVWYRIMRDHASTTGNYQTSNWVSAGTVEIEKPALTDMPYYLSGPVGNVLVYNDEEQELITAGTEFCTSYNQSAGGVLYVVKQKHEMPTAAEEAAALSDVKDVKGKNAGTYYVYYKILKDGAYYIYDSPWTEVGVGGVQIEKRNITVDDFSITWAAEPLTYNEASQKFVTDFAWTGSVERSKTVEYIVNDEAPAATAEAINAGKYSITVQFSGDDNHKPGKLLLRQEFEIAKAEYTITGPKEVELTYDGTPQNNLKVGAGANYVFPEFNGTKHTAGDELIQYSKKDDFSTKVTNPANAYLKSTDAGTYTIYWRLNPDKAVNANFVDASGSFTFEIKKADWVPVTPALTADWEYDAKEYPLLAGPVTAPGAQTTDVAAIKYYINDGEAIEYDAVKAKDVGEYEIWFSVDEADNYNAYPKTSLGTVTVDKHGVDVTAQPVTVNWTGTPVEASQLISVDPTDMLPDEDPDVIAGLAAALAGFKAGEFKENDGTNITVVDPIPSDAGNYTFVLETKENKNYKINNFAPNGSLTIVPIDATPATVTAATLTYDGTEPELVVVDETPLDGGTMLYYLGETAPLPGDTKWTAEIPTAKDAGDYTVWYMVDVDKNHKKFDAVKVPVTIAQKNIADAVFTIDPSESIYSGLNQNETVITVVPDAAEPMDVAKDIESVTLPATVISEGDYEVTIVAKGNYTGTITKTFTINQNTVNNAVVTIEGWTYGETPNAPVTTADFGAETVKYEYSVKDADDWKDEVPTEANDYTVRATIAATADYVGATATADFTIEKADATIDAETAAIKLTYNGKDQELVKAAKSADGTFEYTIDGGETWTSDVPVAKNAGDYKVVTKFTPDGNHNEATIADVDVTINKAPIGYMLGNMTKTWDGVSLNDESQKENLAKVFSVVSGELFEDDIYDVPFVLSLPEDYLDAGTYQPTMAIATFKEGYPENYKVNFTGIANIVIEKAPIAAGDYKAPTAVEGLAYTGDEWDLVEGAEVTTLNAPDYPEIGGMAIGTIVYATEKDGEYDETVPAGKDAGEYSVWYKVVGDKNHLDTEATEIKVTIAEKALKDEFFALTPATAEYNKTNLKPEVSTIKDEPITSDDYVVTITDADGNEVTELINAGTYTFTFTPSKESNYGGSATATFEITPRPVQAVAYNAEKVYDGIDGLNGTKVDFTFTNMIPGEEEGAIKMGDAVYFDGEAKNVGTYPMLFNLGAFDSQNYEVIAVENTGATFTITKAPLTVEWNEEVELPAFTKFYGADDATANVEATAANIVLTGAVAAEEAEIIANTVITRDEGEDIGKYGITLSAKQILENKEYVDAHVFDNYDYDFGTAANVFEILPAEIIVAVAPQSVTYNGTKVTELEISADDLVVTNLVGQEVKGVVFTKVPKAVVTGEAINAGEYELTIDGAEATNYEIKKYFTSTLTIEPVMVNAKFNNKPVAVEGDDAEVILNKVNWTVEADDEADQATVDANMSLFELQFTAGVVAGGKIATDDGEDALVIVYKGTETPANFEFIEAYGDLNIGGEGVEIALDDSKAIETKATKKADVTFTQNRAVPEDVWQACVLPFTVSIEQLSDAFGYAAVDLFDPSRTNAEEVHFSLQVSGSIEAGTPFLFKTNNTTNFTDVIFEDVDVVATADLDPVVKDDDTNIQFIGTFDQVKFYGEQYRYLSKGTWYNAKNFSESKPVSLKPLRAYLDMEGAATARIFIEEPDGTVTAIDAVEFNNQAAEGMYNLNGMKVNQGLKGVYIQNGKKVIKK